MHKSIIKIHPYPDGNIFAITFIDDTDLSTRENTEVVYEYLYRKKIKGTKTVWVKKPKRNSIFRQRGEHTIYEDGESGSTLEDNNYLEFVHDIKNKGFEIGMHGISAGNSYRDEIIEGIELYRNMIGDYPKINVFHQTNIENLYCGYYKLDSRILKYLENMVEGSEYAGHIEGSPYFWGDIAKNKIKYIRLPFHTIFDVNTYKLNPSMPFHDNIRPFVNYWFASSDGSDCNRFNKLLNYNNMMKLKNENGACIVYTHFAKGFSYRSGGKYVLNDEFIDTLNNISNIKHLWTPTTSELLDRLELFKMLNISYENNFLKIHNTGNEDVYGLTITANDDIILHDVISNNTYESNGETIVIDRIPKHDCINLESSNKIKYVNNYKINNNIRRERKLIEYSNYIGLIRQYIAERF